MNDIILQIDPYNHYSGNLSLLRMLTSKVAAKYYLQNP